MLWWEPVTSCQWKSESFTEKAKVFKGALRSKNVLIKRERASSTDVFYASTNYMNTLFSWWINKLTLLENRISFCFTISCSLKSEKGTRWPERQKSNSQTSASGYLQDIIICVLLTCYQYVYTYILTVCKPSWVYNPKKPVI